MPVRSAMRSSSAMSDASTPSSRWTPRRSATPAQSERSFASPPPRTPSETPGASTSSTQPHESRLPNSLQPPKNFEDFLPPRQAEYQRLTRSASRLQASMRLSNSSFSAQASSSESSFAGAVPISSRVGEYYRHRRKCQQTDDEKAAAAHSLAKGKGGESHHQHYTFWYESEAKEPVASPPDLTNQSTLTLGDIFCHHYGKRQVQMWLWALGDDGSAHWMPAAIGDRREDDQRLLSLTDTLWPSWVTEEWYRKRQGGKKGARKPY
ncbi:hypothetical protein C8Q79DRAFT_1013008 [Trametes meyenii]|nr:hypothetical protein C8Q79DRAFT_1013008 [Trametes meyenii]